MTELVHNSVLLKEAVDSLGIRSNEIYVDATFGRGGYTFEMLKNINQGHVISLDLDEAAISFGKQRFNSEIKTNRLILLKSNYGQIKDAVSSAGFNSVSGIVFDLGVSSPQFDDPERGFSYRFDGPLDMRMDQKQDLTAYDVINTYSAEELKKVFQKYGNAPVPYKVANAIVKSRSRRSIKTTLELVKIIEDSLPEPVKRKKGHPSKKFFQAIRIEVNNELDSLKDGLRQSLEILKVGGIISVVTFQPLEDRLVSKTFRRLAQYKSYPKGIPIIPEDVKPQLEIVQKKAITPTEAELTNNHRAHSARLRVAKKIRKISFR
ncbi:16S rRNA (cytosine(1402)-N(4))-methyltransferase RsmH [Xylocopilactobacillus apis]|uniref:Ribosomal RNA small subunit methyltransferase H n=1 Tax=Xylocopilactobacillus apis TaxID=2932183 RepID=A0AAU9DKZ3_9LACO|nr:16S rRNA (cytosine(1402)-N(4))-methyltransferase RsmH [Xylocopilactobacillus apis]BDR56209.1 ribosomal RNA small subunit methyltransferase H [Xylocopilactobacillus apis]